jgi:hypothetical protein
MPWSGFVGGGGVEDAAGRDLRLSGFSVSRRICGPIAALLYTMCFRVDKRRLNWANYSILRLMF